MYEPKQVRDFLISAKLADPRPLINVCDKHGFVSELIKYFHSRNQMKFIEQYALKVNPSSIPLVCGTLLDLQVNQDFIKTLILEGAASVPASELMKEMECRNQLKMILPWLEARRNEGSTDSGVHTALAKIYIDMNNNPERFLMQDNYYNCLEMGTYCESRNPNLAIICYTKGGCDQQVIECTSKNNMFKEQAKFLLQKQNPALWPLVLAEENDSRQHLIDQLVGVVIPECKEEGKIAVVVKVFLEADLPQFLIELLDKLVLNGGMFVGNGPSKPLSRPGLCGAYS